jgi:hypothetical protein
MGFASKFLSRNVRTFAGSSMTTSFQTVGAVTTIVGYKIAILNGTTTDVVITDGSSQDNWYVPAGLTYNIGEGISSFAAQGDRMASVEKGAQFSVKLPSGSAGTGNLSIIIVGN